MKRGFTLIELLIVITIIAILTVITVSQFQLARKRANDAQRKTDLTNLGKALQLYYADYGVFPEASDEGQLTNGTTATGISWGEEFKDATGYSYMKVLPKDNGTIPYCYVTAADKKSFALFAMLENTEDSQCVMENGVGKYNQCGNRYCYSVVSPNADVNSF